MVFSMNQIKTQNMYCYAVIIDMVGPTVNITVQLPLSGMHTEYGQEYQSLLLDTSSL